MKHLKLFENQKWTDQSLRKVLKGYNYIIECIFKYLKYSLDDDEFVDLNISEDFYSMWFAENWTTKPRLGEYFGFNYIDDSGDDRSYTMNKEEYDEFIKFMNDPEIYINSKKYNT